MAWRRGGPAHEDDEQWPGLSVESLEFDDDEDPDTSPDSPLGAAFDAPFDAPFDARSHAPSDASGPDVLSGDAGSRWTRIPLRYRVTAATAALALAAGAVAAVQLDRAARRREAAEFTLAVVDDRYQPAISEVGLDLGLTLVDQGPAPVTVVFLQVSQPGLKLSFYPVRVPLTVGKPAALTLVGVFDCQDTAPAHANTVEVTVNGQSGAISSVTLKLAPGSTPPTGWQNQRSVFCSLPGTSTSH